METTQPNGAGSPRVLRDLEENLKAQPDMRKAFQALRASERKHRMLLEELELGTMEVDLKGVIVAVHDRFLAMTGYARKDLVGKSGDVLLDDEGRRIMAEALENRKRGVATSYEIPLRHKLGHRIWLLITGAPVRNVQGDVVGSLGIHFDITARKELEVEMQRAMANEALARQRERSLLMKMSHELRTPINAINGLFHLLDSRGWSEEEQVLWHGAQRASAMLRGVVDEVLTLSKLESGTPQVNRHRVNVVEVTSGLAKMNHLLAEQKGLALECACHLKTKNRYLDVDKWLQILTNLLANAIKYTSEGHVTLDIWEEDHRPDWIYAEVRDTGPGIPEEEREAIFTPFGSSGLSDHGGMGSSGLGLSIARELAQLMGGSLLLMPSDVGARFVLEIPAQTWSSEPSDGTSGSAPEVPVWDGSHLHVLLAEDNELNVLVAKALLERWKVACTVVGTGLDALEAMQHATFDAVLLDVQMPNLDGLQTLQRIRSSERALGVVSPKPVFMVTAYADERTRNSAEQAGCTGFLAKPFSPRDLLAVLQSVRP